MFAVEFIFEGFTARSVVLLGPSVEDPEGGRQLFPQHVLPPCYLKS